MLRSFVQSFVLWSFIYAASANEKLIVLDPSYDHNKYSTLPEDIIKEYRAYITSFDSADDDNGDGEPDFLGLPEWVSYEIKRFDGNCIPTKSRPPWFSDEDLVNNGIAPTDESYKYSRSWRSIHPNWYVRGHLAMKLIAERLGHDAAHNTHTMLNAVPQRSKFNSGIWLELEYLTAAWAQKFGSVWVITGPIIIDRKPSGWIGEDNEFKVAIPEALFKIIIKEGTEPNKPDVLAFIYPQVGPSYLGIIPFPHHHYLTSVDEIEKATGLDFLSILPNDIENIIEKEEKHLLWGVEDSDFIFACRS